MRGDHLVSLEGHLALLDMVVTQSVFVSCSTLKAFTCLLRWRLGAHACGSFPGESTYSFSLPFRLRDFSSVLQLQTSTRAVFAQNPLRVTLRVRQIASGTISWGMATQRFRPRSDFESQKDRGRQCMRKPLHVMFQNPSAHLHPLGKTRRPPGCQWSLPRLGNS